MSSLISCVGVIGKENEPLYIEVFADDGAESTVKYQYQVHYSLDIVDEKFAASKRFSGPAPDLYVGLLLSIEDQKIYGHVTNTKIKFILIAKDALLETQAKAFLKDLNNLYAAAVCNPFSVASKALDAKSFGAAVGKLVQLTKPVTAAFTNG